jgi:hypothetical protein
MFSDTCTGLPGLGLADADALELDDGADALELAVTVTVDPVLPPPPEEHAARAREAPAIRASATHIRRGRGEKLGFVTPPR